MSGVGDGPLGGVAVGARERVQQLALGGDAVGDTRRAGRRGPVHLRHRRHRGEDRAQQVGILAPHRRVEIGRAVPLVAVLVEELVHRRVAVGERPQRSRHLVVVRVAVPTVQAGQELRLARGSAGGEQRHERLPRERGDVGHDDGALEETAVGLAPPVGGTGDVRQHLRSGHGTPEVLHVGVEPLRARVDTGAHLGVAFGDQGMAFG